MQPCLIQVEYFHITSTGSLDDVWRECMNRTMETLPDAINGLNDLGPGIKTCLRFQDVEDGTITRLALSIERLNKESDRVVSKMISPGISWLWRKLYRWQWHRLCLTLKANIKMLERALMDHIPQARLAIEKTDHRYRLLRDDEKHEVLTKTKMASGFWMFVFSPNDLLSENNELVAAVM